MSSNLAIFMDVRIFLRFGFPLQIKPEFEVYEDSSSLARPTNYSTVSAISLFPYKWIIILLTQHIFSYIMKQSFLKLKLVELSIKQVSLLWIIFDDLEVFHILKHKWKPECQNLSFRCRCSTHEVCACIMSHATDLHPWFAAHKGKLCRACLTFLRVNVCLCVCRNSVCAKVSHFTWLLKHTCVVTDALCWDKMCCFGSDVLCCGRCVLLWIMCFVLELMCCLVFWFYSTAPS